MLIKHKETCVVNAQSHPLLIDVNEHANAQINDLFVRLAAIDGDSYRDVLLGRRTGRIPELGTNSTLPGLTPSPRKQTYRTARKKLDTARRVHTTIPANANRRTRAGQEDSHTRFRRRPSNSPFVSPSLYAATVPGALRVLTMFADHQGRCHSLLSYLCEAVLVRCARRTLSLLCSLRLCRQ